MKYTKSDIEIVRLEGYDASNNQVLSSGGSAMNKKLLANEMFDLLKVIFENNDIISDYYRNKYADILKQIDTGIIK